MDYTYLQVAKMIDHSLLNPVLTDHGLEAGRAIGVPRSGATRTAEMLTECRRRLGVGVTEAAAQTL